MLFNALPFVIFFTVFFFLYWFAVQRSLKLQNLLVLAGSYVFYGWWDWHFLLLLILSTLLTYILGRAIYKAPDPKVKKQFLNIGVLLSVGALLYFKYTNFFITSFVALLSKLHIHSNVSTLNILLPLGISFYTFRMLSYLFEINNGKFKPTEDWVVFFSYIAFFPSLVSGPIDRPRTLIPQLEKPRVFDNAQATDGMRQILWGLFKKIVIADNCSLIVNHIFETPQLHGMVLVAGAFFFTVQLYADFSGYSDMAIGIAHLLGFSITRNFNNPYFAQNVAEFWRKWHISLTSWLTDYIFTPASIQFRNFGNWGLIISILITFLVSGLWHGANYTFIVWGFLHGCYFIPLILKGKMNKKKEIPIGKAPSVRELMNIIGTFLLVMFTMVLFRANGLKTAFDYYRNMFVLAPASNAYLYPLWFYSLVLFFICFMFSMEWRNRDKQHALEALGLKWRVQYRWAFYTLAFLLIMAFTGHEQQFIYFKF